MSTRMSSAVGAARTSVPNGISRVVDEVGDHDGGGILDAGPTTQGTAALGQDGLDALRDGTMTAREDSRAEEGHRGHEPRDREVGAEREEEPSRRPRRAGDQRDLELEAAPCSTQDDDRDTDRPRREMANVSARPAWGTRCWVSWRPRAPSPSAPRPGLRPGIDRRDIRLGHEALPAGDRLAAGRGGQTRGCGRRRGRARRDAVPVDGRDGGGALRAGAAAA